MHNTCHLKVHSCVFDRNVQYDDKVSKTSLSLDQLAMLPTQALWDWNMVSFFSFLKRLCFQLLHWLAAGDSQAAVNDGKCLDL